MRNAPRQAILAARRKGRNASPAVRPGASVLPAESRLTPGDFRHVRGRSVGETGLHALALPALACGLCGVEGRGYAVTRNRVKRQLRHLVAEALLSSTVSVDVVVRALPAAASTDFRGFPDAFGAALAKRGSMKYVLIGLLKLYRRSSAPVRAGVQVLSELLGVLAEGCRDMVPDGTIPTVKRLALSPWSAGGYDPVPGPKLVRCREPFPFSSSRLRSSVGALTR